MSDDFFSRDDDNDGRAPPKAAASLAASTAVRQRKGPPPPPPRRPAGTAATSTTTSITTAAAASTRPRPTPSRPTGTGTAATTTTTTGTTSAASTRPRPTPRATTAKAKPNTATTTTSTLGTVSPSGNTTVTLPTARSSIRTAPVMSRPVGQYYAADTASYSQAQPDETSPEDTWDWGAQTPAPAPQPWVAPNPHSWAAPATDSTAASSTSGGDWYATDSHAQTNNSNGMYPYTSSGFYGAAAPQPIEPQQNAFLSGRMDDAPGAAAPTVFQPKPFVPQVPSAPSNSYVMTGQEAPLLEELGINLEHISMKTKAVVLPFSRFGGASMEPADLVKDADLAGPIAFCLILGAEMVLTGKLQFGYIYGFGVFGCASMTLIVNLMSPLAEGISIWTVSSVLGYALIPVNLLAAVKLIVINLVNLQTLGRVLGLLTVAWSTIASTRLLELGFGLREQRYLIAYPVALLYSAFVMITIF